MFPGACDYVTLSSMNLVTVTDLFKNVVEVSHGLFAVIRYESTECVIGEIVIRWPEV
jgi:hypothetical protein